MATENKASPTPAPLEQFQPTFNARRFVAPSAGFDADFPRGVPSPAEGGWRWIGEAETLGEFGAQAGQQVEPGVYERVERGQHPVTYERVRKANTVERHLDDPERAAAAKGKESSHLHGLVHLSGSYGAPEAAEQAWRQGGPEDREKIEGWLIRDTRAGIGSISGTDFFAGAAVVRDDEKAGLRVDWVAVGAARDNGIASPYHRGGIKTVDVFARERAGRIRARLEGMAQGARQAEREPVTAPAAPVKEPAAVPVKEPSPEPGVKIPSPRAPRAELPSRPLDDSLFAYSGRLGDKAALDIKGRADDVAKNQRLDQLSEQELLKRLPHANPFGKIPNDGDKAKLSLWWRDHGVEATHVAATEGVLIERAREGYRQLAERERKRRGVDTPDPMKAVRAARGDQFADKVERRATVLASNLGTMPEQQRGERTAALRQEIQTTGLEKADFSAITQSVALQHGRNADNELQAAREQGKSVTHDQGRGVGETLGIG